jgi:Arc/MetJ family transcription regulator
MNTRTNIVLDDALVEQAMQRAGVTTKKAAIDAALRAYVRRPDYAALLAMEGSGLVADDYDPKASTPAPVAGAPAARKPSAPTSRPRKTKR